MVLKQLEAFLKDKGKTLDQCDEKFIQTVNDTLKQIEEGDFDEEKIAEMDNSLIDLYSQTHQEPPAPAPAPEVKEEDQSVDFDKKLKDSHNKKKTRSMVIGK